MARTKTIAGQQSFGFPDEDLKTSLHDEIVLWLKKDATNIAKRIINWSEQLDANQIQNAKAAVKSDINELKKQLESEIQSYSSFSHGGFSSNEKRYHKEIDILKEKLKTINLWPGIKSPPLCKIEVETKIELPITRERYKAFDIIGYADIVYYVRTHCPRPNRPSRNNFGKLESEFQFLQKTDWHMIWNGPTKIAFDAKTKIVSLGELIRQLNTYRSFCSWPFFVVSPDDRFANDIANEGYGFITYPQGKVTLPKQNER